ncbi:unnamed protein product [Durusdinium trenchii]|uniref:Uncharacterized protein n=2 Tax=Durusdinium trenchii TaxID=1381693 RepID=A0ABP0J603_9DINO
MPCYKELALVPLDAGFIRGSHLVRSGRGPRSEVDTKTWEPAYTVEQARLAELRHAEVLSRSAHAHLRRSGSAPLKCEATLEESKYFRRLGAPIPSRTSLGLRG